jgi:predicted CoA-substrate-specific enzyme activase
MSDLFFGIDIGSTTIKVVILNLRGELLSQRYLRSEGQPKSKLLSLIDDLFPKFTAKDIAGIMFTGSGGNAVAEQIGCPHTNELVAQTRAVGKYYPQARTIIEIGGQDSKFMSVKWNEGSGRMDLLDFAMNTLCAAGTGSFLDQQAERLNIPINDQFSKLALKSTNPARIAGRCAVFAKSDMIHLQQKGTPLCDILAGLCLALARNFKSVVGKGKPFIAPILFQGGVAFNQAVAQAFETILKLEPGELIIPKYHWCMPALGAALIAIEEATNSTLFSFHGFDSLKDDTGNGSGTKQKIMPALNSKLHLVRGKKDFVTEYRNNGRPMHDTQAVYLGIDVGSISTKIVLIDKLGHVVARRYLYSNGRPVESICQGLQWVADEVGEQVKVQGVGTTGSGRYLTGHLVGADVVCNEITTQARAAVQIDPAVDTIFEIGGQDSKFISLSQGAIIDFAMNKACAAGTGSFLQEQSDRLNINLQEEFSQLAFTSDAPACLGERCTVFMESDLVHHQQQGAQVKDLAGGLAYSIAKNYLNRVVNRRAIGRNIFFQGGVAWNQSVVTALGHLTGREIRVPPHHDVTGAIGAALLAMEEMARRRQRDQKVVSTFKGFRLANKHIKTTSFDCKACPNICAVNKLVIDGKSTIYFGARCDRFERAGQPKNRAGQVPDLFAERNVLLLSGYEEPDERRSDRPRVGFPRVLLFHDMFPYWRAFFDTLEFDLILSTPTNPKILRDSAEHANAEMCLPAKLIFGHVDNLINRGVDYIFLPSVRNRENIAPGQTQNFCCPYIQTVPSLVQAYLEVEQIVQPILTFPYYLLWPQVRRKMLKNVAFELNVSERRIKKAAQAAAIAQKEYYRKLKCRGQEIINHLPPDKKAIVLIGRPYSTGDPGICQDLSYKLRQLGELPIPMEYLPLEKVDISERYDNIYWRSGQDILAAAKVVRDHPQLQAIYLTNFGCGPDSFLIGFFRQIMYPKPFLLLEIDDHTADAGIMTRCEAFLESLKMEKQVRAHE